MTPPPGLLGKAYAPTFWAFVAIVALISVVLVVW